jgi:hypothetical protein
MRRALPAVLLTVLAVAGCGPATGSTSGDAAPAQSSAAPSLSSAVSPSPAETGAAALAAWLNAGGDKQLDLISADLGAVKTGLSDPARAGLDEACAKLTADAESLQLEKPMPDERAAGEWKLSLNYLQKAATECTAGDYTAMATDLSIGIHHVSAVTDAVTG